MERTDAELLRDYADGGSDAAFSEIARRHADLVYSSALRQTGSTETARDISQEVFTALARKARALSATFGPNESLAGWLYRGTRYAVLMHLRSERRRQFRERRLMNDLESGPTEAAAWEEIVPVLDKAMNKLGETDRTALLLRFFKNQDFRAVGLNLGLSDDAAQKRVARALEKLRVELSGRGIAASAAGLSTLLGANAVQAAPAGLIAAISSAALVSTGVTAPATILTATKAIAMTTMQKTLVATTLVLAVGTGVYEAQRAARLQKQVNGLEQARGLAGQLTRTQTEFDRTNNALATARQENERLRRELGDLHKLRAEVTQLRRDSRELARLKSAEEQGDRDPTEAEMKSWLARVDRLKEQFEIRPDQTIPEFRLLTEQDWLNASRGNLETEEDWRRAMSNLRGAAEFKIVPRFHEALKKYMDSNNGELPRTMDALTGYFKEPVDAAILQRYEVVPSESIPTVSLGMDWVVTQKEPVDPDYDSRAVIGPYGHGSTSWKNRELDGAPQSAGSHRRSLQKGQ
jgi:RNA polymerase sigma factor (sigma-70 family)